MNVSDRSESTAPDGPGAGNHVHVTFSFHCAVLRQPDKRRTDVLLAPGMRHGVAGGAAGGTDTTEHGSRRNGGATVHQAEHIASLRVPANASRTTRRTLASVRSPRGSIAPTSRT